MFGQVKIPSLIHLVNVPEMNITTAIPMPDVITNGRRLKRFKNHAFDRDIKNRVTPTKIDTWYALTLLPISYGEKTSSEFYVCSSSKGFPI